MALNFWNVEWLVQNSQRRYPLAGDTSALDTTGVFQLPDDFLLGLRLPVHYGQNVIPGNFLLWKIGVYASGFSLVIGYDTGSGIVPVASTTIARSAHAFGNVYALGGVGDFWDSYGHVTLGNLELIDKQPTGLFLFDQVGARLEVDCIRPFLRTLQALYVRNGEDLSPPLVGDIELVAATNFAITPVLVSGQRPQLLLSAIDGAGLNEDCFCAGDTTPAGPIKLINAIHPKPDGDFDILGDNQDIEIVPLEHGIMIKNKLTPCCDCQELEVVTQSLQQLLPRVATVEGNVSRLSAVIDQFTNVVLGSRLSDQGCFTCE